MIRHIVMWKLKENALGRDRAANVREMKARLEALNGRIPGLLRLEVGLDFSATDSSCDVVLVSDFDSREALEAYQEHPEHVALAAMITQIRSERRLVDYEI